MNSPQAQDVTHILQDWSDGDQDAPARLMPLVYEELRRLARDYLRHQRSGHTLPATVLVHEAYLRMVDQQSVSWQNRLHFFAVAAQVMRYILIDYARAHTAAKRGGSARKLSLDEAKISPQERAAELVAVDDALKSLAKVDRRKSQVVELRYFGGLSVEEIAGVLGVSEKTVRRDWHMAKLWLYRELSQEQAS